MRGDLFSAIRFFRSRQRSSIRQWCVMQTARLQANVSSRFSGRGAAGRNIRFHYDRSNEFYRQFLDSRMLYSAAHFSGRAATLEDAQLEKLERICNSLDLRPGQRFLDIGCGWGALAVYAAEHFGVHATGCTLSRNQFEYARNVARERRIESRVSILETDYRELEGQFDSIASVGMFEHVGISRLGEYFRRVHSLLQDGGRFLNRGIVRPETISDDPETLFLRKSVFPGGELVHLSDTLREAERAGFQTLQMEDLREHYALTCRAWVARLQENVQECMRLVGGVTYRTWLLYLAASVVSFEDGISDAAQLTFAKPPHGGFPYPESRPE